MDVTSFLLVSVCSSIAQLHDSVGSRDACLRSEAGFSSQNGYVLEEYITEKQRCCAFLWVGGLTAKNIHKEMFPAYGGKCLSREAIHNLVEKRGKYFVDDEEVEMVVAETTVKILMCCGNPCGGGVEYLHREPAGRKRRRNGTKKGRAIA
jgi:hypothetical protein